MSFVNSPNMGFPVPTIANEPGPQYATDVNQALLTLDSHNHSPGQGVPIGSQGINLQTDLTFNTNNAIGLRSARFVSTTASSGTDIGCLYVKGIDLFYNDLNGNVIPVTRNGALASTSIFSGQISTTAIVSANGAGAPASSGFIRMDNNFDHINWRNAANNADDSFYVDGSDKFHMVGPAYDYAFPNTLPTSSLPLSIATNGVMSFGLITRPQLPNVGLQATTSCGNFFDSSDATVDVTNLSLNLTTTGRPVYLTLVPQNGQQDGDIGQVRVQDTGNTATGTLFFTRNSVQIAAFDLFGQAAGATSISIASPAGSINYIDLVPSSTYSYKVQARSNSSTVSVNKCRFFAYEL